MLLRLSGVFALMLAAACSAQAPEGNPQQQATAAAESQAPAPAAAADGVQYQAGVDYFPVPSPQPIAPDNGRIDVVEVFGYSCIHCAHAQPFVDEWKKTLADDVAFTYVPAVFGGIWEVFARAYYTAQTMGVLSRSHNAMFKAVHEEHRAFRSVDDIAAFYAERGVTKEQVLATMSSFEVNAKVAEAQQQVPAWGVEGTPSFIVAGKYRVVAPREGSFEKMLDIVDFLVAKERAERAAG